MPIPKEIKKKHIDKAIVEIDPQKIPKQRLSYHYMLLASGKELPPKYTLSIANRIVNGEMLDPHAFNAVEAKLFLRSLGYDIRENQQPNGFATYVKKFINQAQTTNLSIQGYPNEFQDLIVRVGFGKGNIARIPWIAFLDEISKVQNGIYPVYLYYKSEKLLILAFGISETNVPNRTWGPLSISETISDHFKILGLNPPLRYGKSIVFRTYDLNQKIDESEINQDLEEILEIYKNLDNGNGTIKPSKEFDPIDLSESMIESELRFTNSLLTRFTASLLTKPFVILTGLSGSGKTKLAQAFAQWICADENQYKIIPVGADWTNREPLLGYPNALDTKQYVKPDSGVLDLIIRAGENPDLPFFLILDEMNLSHVERYFADFLSVMESGEPIPLFAEGTATNGVPAKLSLPKNLFIIGTVNIDETTNMFSPKVLDRANTIEFRVTRNEMDAFLENIRDLDMKALEGKGREMAGSFLQMASDRSLMAEDLGAIRESLGRFFSELKKAGAEFGYRSASEMLRLMHHLTQLDPGMSTDTKLDIAIMQKLLPKLHGSRRKLVPVLTTLGNFCVSEGVKVETEVFENAGFDFDDAKKVIYPLSLEKITRMHKIAIDTGYTSFAEA